MLPCFLANQWQFPHSVFRCLYPAVNSCGLSCSELQCPGWSCLVSHWSISSAQKSLWMLGLKSLNHWKLNFSHVPRILYNGQFRMASHGNYKDIKFSSLFWTLVYFKENIATYGQSFPLDLILQIILSSLAETLQEFSAFNLLARKFPD